MRQTSFVRQLGKRVDIAVFPELKAKELEKKMTCSNDCSGEKPLIDAPIRSSAEDDLGRAPIAHAFARSILELDASQGLVVGVLGPWGHGKSSFINLMREEFEGIPKEFESSEESEPTSEGSETRRALTVIDFNPWMFSGSDQLIHFFFTQIGAELKVKNESRLGKIADWLGQYAGVLKPAAQFFSLPGASAVGEGIAAGISGLAGTTSADRSVQKVKDDITEALSKLEKPIVVVIDDIDRLTKIEIREIFKLVRLTASFPNIIYLLAFDRERVEQALSEDGISGRAYLEKIVLLSFDVPQAQWKPFQSRISAELDHILALITNTTFDKDRWDYLVYPKVIMPLLSTIRDVKRYFISTKQTIKNLGDQIDLVDLFAMEALRIFHPEIFRRLVKLRYELTEAYNFMDQKDERSKKTIEKLLEDFPDDNVIHSLIEYVFPAALSAHESGDLGSWRAAHRMADIEFLNLYFDRVAPDQLVAFRHSEHAFSFLNNRAALKKYLIESVSPEMLEDVIFGFISLEEMFTDDMTVPGSITLLNLIGVVPEQQRLFDAVGRVVYKLLCHVENEKKREDFTEQVLKDIETYSSMIYFIDVVLGARTDVGNLPVKTNFRGEIRRRFAKKVGKTAPPMPLREWDIGRVYKAFLEETYADKKSKAPLSSNDDPVLLQKVLHSLKSAEPTQSSNFPQIWSDNDLDWDDLVKLFDSEDHIGAALSKVRAKFGDDEVLRLVDRYLGGWRPEFFYTGQSQAKETKN